MLISESNDDLPQGFELDETDIELLYDNFESRLRGPYATRNCNPDHIWSHDQEDIETSIAMTEDRQDLTYDPKCIYLQCRFCEQNKIERQ